MAPAEVCSTVHVLRLALLGTRRGATIPATKEVAMARKDKGGKKVKKPKQDKAKKGSGGK